MIHPNVKTASPSARRFHIQVGGVQNVQQDYFGIGKMTCAVHEQATLAERDQGVACSDGGIFLHCPETFNVQLEFRHV